MKRLSRITLGIILMIIGAALIITSFRGMSAHAATPLPEWSVDTPPAKTKRKIHWSAGCYIPTEGGVVVTISRSGFIQLPFGKVKHTDGTPRETAIRETLEETGLTVETHEVVAAFDGGPALVEGDINQHLLYRCTVAGDGIINYEAMDATEVAEALVLNPMTMRAQDGKEVMAPWRFPRDHDLLLFLLQRKE
jgi:8-oxo-dGTP pyrophosphatase MutT (NUDIX family)